MTRNAAFAPAALMALPLAVLFALGALGGILLPDVYARESATWAAQGIGQDWVDLVVVSPTLLVAALLTRRGSRAASFLLAGALAYTGYSLVLYAFAVHFNSLFLVYSLGLGLSFYALVAIVVAFAGEDVRGWFSAATPVRGVGSFTAALGAAFYVLWLSEVVPALFAHATPKSVLDAGLITNPVQVLDIGIVLPAFLVGGVALVRRRAIGYWLAATMLSFGLFMDLALVGMVVSMSRRGAPDGGPPLPLFVLLTLLDGLALWLLLRSLAPEERASAV